MKLQMKRIAAALLATGMLLCALPVAAFAADETTDATENTYGHGYPGSWGGYQTNSDYKGCDGSVLQLKKCLKLDYTATSLADVPYAACNFKLEATEANPNKMNAAKTYNGWTPMAGVLTDNYPKEQTVAFQPNDDKVTLSTDKTSACKDFSYDFKAMLDAGKYQSGCVYCYKVTETGAAPTYIKADSDNIRYVDVYVGYKENSNHEEELAILKIISYRMNSIGFGSFACKNNSFENCYRTTTLDLTKLITGNQCDKTKQFDFTVVINTGVGQVASTDSLMKGYTMYIKGISSTPNLVHDGKMIVDKYGKSTQTGTMTNNDHVQITNIPLGSTYQITENKGNYTLTITGEGTKIKDGCSGTVNNNNITFTNNKSGQIPTGVMLDVAPYALMVGLALAGLVAFTIRKRRVQ